MKNIDKIDDLIIYGKIEGINDTEFIEAIIGVKPSIIHNNIEDSYLPLLIKLFDEIEELQIIFHKQSKIIMKEK